MASITYGTAPNPAASIQKERDQTTFDLQEMNLFLEGGDPRVQEAIKEVYFQFERDPIMHTGPGYYDADKSEHRENTARKIARIAQYLEMDGRYPGLQMGAKRLEMYNMLDPQGFTRIGIFLGLFLGCVESNGTAEQYKYWLQTTMGQYVRGIYGCFGMTELAHGSNVAGVETTATFDIATDEFVVTTPHVGATKWWIGGAAHSATHCSVYARLVVKGKDYGVKQFVVPLRDANFDLMPGVTVGDIGAKMGRDGIDNGWIQFNNVRIPRVFMLQKYAKVTRDGAVTDSPLNQLSYAALVGGRVSMVRDSFRFGSRFITIALRYSIGRRQFGKSADGGEIKLLDYPLHQSRLLPFLATVYVMSSTAHKLAEYNVAVNTALDAAVTSRDPKKMGAAMNETKNLFVVSASLKATFTWLTASLIDECRQSCGGHGYSAYTGFGKGYEDWVVQCTWEGDNNVLSMSAGRSLMQSLVKVHKGKQASGELLFLNRYAELGGESEVLVHSSIGDLKSVLQAYQALVIRTADHGVKTLAKENGNWDAIGVIQVSLSKIFAHTYALSSYLAKVQDPAIGGKVQSQLILMAELYALSTLSTFSSLFLQHGIISSGTLAHVQGRLRNLNDQVRPQAIGLTDAFLLPDFIINSPLGRYDGNIYESYFNTVKAQNPPSQTKAPYSETVLEPMLGRSDLAVRERNERSEQVLSILSK
ncbi:hypothetical protein BABINDRAFT_163468 [Babjeviella inositovora NRRL Y-12698]|uniref:Acyl-coenzyme A oxidase n=1 Tax=Babjeviella inositovora NRRL Y-12698 TaxID=984486 RepID=A0A1E3QIB3_9ASCO|nr:uncharacterized protein BABINDRAFT_163468 [Babjeviella inositovora NRRL Y-12698]ODQ77453.1 hypothetical protein BABINDRAFT_163468 [Babjeviella inositovora NRRL Y-12698]